MKSKDDYIKEHFPEVDPGATPCGNQILVQYRTLKSKTSGGIALIQDTKDFNTGNTQVARIVKVGQIAFKDRSTGKEWTEGSWADVGDVVITPRWGGFRFEIPIPNSDDNAIFATFEDFNVKLVIESNFESFDKLL